MAKRKIAILGGGVASITTAYYLTSTPELCDQYDVTVYQMGWRLGGKCASGRNMHYGARIEEHGLHIWLGFYDNAFNLMRTCYDELGRAPGAPLATWQDAFKPHDNVLLNEKWNDQWSFLPFDIPNTPGTPGDGGVLPNFWQAAAMALGWIWELLKDLIESDPDLLRDPTNTGKPDWWDHLVDEIDADIVHHDKGNMPYFELAYQLVQYHAHQLNTAPDSERYSMLCTLMSDFRDWLWTVAEPHLDNAKLRQCFIFTDTGTTVTCGMIQDNVIERGFDVLDNEEFTAWLLRHGISQNPTLTVGPLVRGIYDLAFAYESGKTPNIAAGTALRGMIRLAVTYKGSFYWMMQAGMGDTVFTPLYEVLRRRGVKFQFFNCVTNLGLGTDKQIDTVTIQPQVTLRVGEYDPLVQIKELACWPSEPLYDQIVQGDQLRAQNINLEQACTPFPDIHPISLKRAIDFDEVVLGISIAALPAICRELCTASAPFAAMLNNIKTVQTQAFQLWVNQPMQQLGLDPKTGIMDSYVEPLDTYANMSHLLVRENWPARDNVQTIAYFCGVIEDLPNETQQQADACAKAYALDYIDQSLAHLWPNAFADGKFNWNTLVDPQNSDGAKRFDSQYWRANFQPTERYVLSVAGSTQFRLKSRGTDFPNLILAGDWTLNGLNAGCVEATVMSGMEASRAICGIPKTVIGETDDWL
jgi:uncharacterized protein with NAD-binding domain and iron-sulfur cluster